MFHFKYFNFVELYFELGAIFIIFMLFFLGPQYVTTNIWFIFSFFFKYNYLKAHTQYQIKKKENERNYCKEKNTEIVVPYTTFKPQATIKSRKNLKQNIKNKKKIAKKYENKETGIEVAI